MPLDPEPLQVLAWLVTYLVHSTLLLVLAWLLTRRRAALSLVSRERLWKLAVVGGFLTAALQVGLGLEPPLGRLTLRSGPPALAATPDPAGSAPAPERPSPRSPARAAGRAPARPPAEPLPARDRRAARLPERRADEAPASPAAAFFQTPAQRAPARPDAQLPAALAWPVRAGVDLAARLRPLAAARDEARTARAEQAGPELVRSASRPAAGPLGAVVHERWWRGALVGWALTGLACALLFALGLSRLRRDLEGRVELHEGDVVEEVERLRLRAGVARRVRVFVAPRVAAPLSMGWVRPTICVPPRALDELEREERSAMLAHEVAHLARRDPAWLFVLWLVETAFFFQPLNRLARRELAATFELAADGWAARATGDRLALASGLARIAGWIVGASPPRAHRAWTAAMADALDARRPRSRLGERIERLLDESALAEPSRPRRLERALGPALLVGLALLAPGAAAAGAEPEPAPEPERTRPAAAPAPTRVDRAASSLVSLDEELSRLQAELSALRTELAAAGLEARLDAVLSELELRVARLAARRERIEALLARARALEAATTPTSTHWQDATLPWTKGTSR